MDNNLYIDYLNSLHNYNAQNENAYGERNIDNPYFKDVMVRVGLCDYIKENLTVKKPHILILTGHAGDGKTSIMYQVLTDMGAEFDVKEKLSEITLPNGAKCLCVKDFSEIPEEILFLSLKWIYRNTLYFYNMLIDFIMHTINKFWFKLI